MNNKIIPLYKPTDKILVKSKDCYQYDSDGKEYIDFESGVWCANIGHSNDRIVKLIESQIKESIHHGYKFQNYFALDLSKELQGLIGFKNGATVFLSSGSEAVNLAITISQSITKRKKILKIDNSYLSAYGFGQISPDNDFKIDVPFNDIKSINNIDFAEISAFVIELGGASVEMVRFPDNEFIKKITDLAIENNCLIIAEEVTTGIGRLGKWFGFQHYDIQPDIVVSGKALGNGYPISAVTVSSKVLESFTQNPFRYAQSHQNDPLGCAIGLEVIKTIKENNLISRSQITGEYFKNHLDIIHNKHKNKIKDIRAKGLMLAIEFNENIDGETIDKQLFERGFVIGFKQNTLRFLPPLIIKTSDIDKLVKSLDDILMNVNTTSTKHKGH